MSADPWKDREHVPEGADLSARRVSAGGRWSFFWAVDVARCPLLVLDAAREAGGGAGQWPTLRGLEVRAVRQKASSVDRITLRLKDASLRDIFKELCDALISATECETTEIGALRAFENGLWRWHSLLRGGRQPLSLREQAGLWGELTYLTELAEVRGVHEAIEAWQGPFRAVHDFVMAVADVEVKTVLGDDDDENVRISSEFQLDMTEGRPLYLRIYRVALDDGSHRMASSVVDVAAALRSLIRDAESLARFERRIAAAGLSTLPAVVYRFAAAGRPLDVAVRGDIPRLIPAVLARGIRAVSYAIAITALMPFADATDELVELGLSRGGAP